MKKYLAHDQINGDWEDFDTIEEAREFLTESFLDDDEGYHPDADSCCIYQLYETVKIIELDSKSNYKYSSEDEVPEDDHEAIDNEDFWPHPSQFDFISKHEFIKCSSVDQSHE